MPVVNSKPLPAEEVRFSSETSLVIRIGTLITTQL